MALIDVTPVMTSNTTPSPYIISASSIWSEKYQPWIAFTSNKEDDGCWATISGNLTGWIMIDFSIVTKINALSICQRTKMDTIKEAIKDFSLYGSNDGLTFDLIEEFSNQILWKNSEIRLFSLKSSVKYRYYKIIITANNGLVSYSTIGQIKFFQDDTETDFVDNKKMSMNYCLPSNTTQLMRSRKNDLREGMLGFANDSTNYGTLWMVGKKGQAIIPKSGMTNADLLFDGIANTTNTEYLLDNSFKDYQYLLICDGIDYTNNITTSTLLIPTKIIDFTNTQQFVISTYANSACTRYINFYFSDYNKLMIKLIIQQSGAWGQSYISKIYGIK